MSENGLFRRELPDQFAASLDAELREVTTARSRLPVLALFALLALFLSSGTGIAFSVIPAVRSLRVPDDLVSRVLVFAASVISLLYVLVHICGARTDYVIEHQGAPWLYGNHIHSLALLLTRVGVGVWIAAIVTTGLLVGQIGIRRDATTAQQTIYLNLLICVVSFISLCLVIACIERSRTPFKTAVFSYHRRKWPDEGADVSASRRGSLGDDDIKILASSRRRSVWAQSKQAVVERAHRRSKSTGDVADDEATRRLKSSAHALFSLSSELLAAPSPNAVRHSKPPRARSLIEPTPIYQPPIKRKSLPAGARTSHAEWQLQFDRTRKAQSVSPMTARWRASGRASVYQSREKESFEEHLLNEENYGWEEPATVPEHPSGLSRTARRVRKETQRMLVTQQRAGSLSRNYSRPLRRAKTVGL